jgi:AT-rich interactive domain-containing protein 2
MNYNYSQHHVNNSTNDDGNPTVLLPSSLYSHNPYEKLEISLITGLPNEIDFVFNTLLLLSSDESHSFRVYSSPRLVQLVLAHIGFFGIEDKYNYRHLYDNVWNCYSNDVDLDDDDDVVNCRMANKLKCKPRRSFVRFWHNAVAFPEKCAFTHLNYKSSFSQLLPKLYNDYIHTLPSQELLNLREIKQDLNGNNYTPRGCAIDSIEFRRIEQVMISLNNLSFEESNAEYMANRCLPLIEFLIMCLYCGGSGGSSSTLELKKTLSRHTSQFKPKNKTQSTEPKTQKFSSHVNISFNHWTQSQSSRIATRPPPGTSSQRKR